MPYLPPARISDFSRSAAAETLRQNWHDKIEAQMANYRGFSRFLDPALADATATRAAIPWPGFPRLFDAWLDLDGAADPVERARREDRANRSAEIPARLAYVQLQHNGKFLLVPADPAQGWMLFPEQNGAAAVGRGFALSERPQDEYLEWFVVRDPVSHRVARIDFTVEAPEYWETMAEVDPKLTAKIYSECLGLAVPENDLYFQTNTYCAVLKKDGAHVRVVGHTPVPGLEAGRYNPSNKWNTELGAVHLTHRSNTLFAEINLAAVATQKFPARPNLDTDISRFELTACGGFGDINRNSDPSIGFAVNTLCLSGLKAMVSNPIGLYIGEIDVSGFRDPDGKPVSRDDILTIQRGNFNDEDHLARVLRFSIHPPAGANYGLEACMFDGQPLSTGGPVARKTRVIIHAVAMRTTEPHGETPCEGHACAHPTKLPNYFLVAAPDSACPSADAADWAEPPAILAPDTGRMMDAARTARTAGRNSIS